MFRVKHVTESNLTALRRTKIQNTVVVACGCSVMKFLCQLATPFVVRLWRHVGVL